MPIVNNLLIGYAAGTSLGLAPDKFGKLLFITCFLKSPILALVAAKSLASKDGGTKEPDDPLERAVIEAKAAAADAGAANKATAESRAVTEKAAAGAVGSQQAAAASEGKARDAANSAQKSASIAGDAAAEAKKYAEGAQQVAGKK